MNTRLEAAVGGKNCVNATKWKNKRKVLLKTKELEPLTPLTLLLITRTTKKTKLHRVECLVSMAFTRGAPHPSGQASRVCVAG